MSEPYEEFIIYVNELLCLFLKANTLKIKNPAMSCPQLWEVALLEIIIIP
jgi:hypothetical protein